ncbi:MAG TPA: phosphate ABC transporter permease subunit PstC [Moorella mulderi]|nr:phosphate ABC transporter permease subunit PstC [Moorella mulderi]
MLGRRIRERFYESLLFISALISVVAVFMIALFVFLEGYPIIQKEGLGNFLLGREWRPVAGIFGIFPMIVGSLVVTLGALVLGVPVSLATAVFLAEFAPKRADMILRPGIELLAGIPSVIYGLFGMTTVVPAIRFIETHYLAHKLPPQMQSGYSVLAAAIILAIMISPTIIAISEDALRAVPRHLKEASLALGATHWQTVVKVLIPTARSGILASIILGMGRAIGETMAVIMVVGNNVLIPTSIFSPCRTLTSNIAIEAAYAAEGPHMQALFATGIVLFVIIIILNLIALRVAGREVMSR